MTRRDLWFLPLFARIGYNLTIPDPRRLARAIGVPKGWAIQKLENIYSPNGKHSLRWVSLYEVGTEPQKWVFAALPTWEAAGRLAVAKIWPTP
jgi:hypothetical protein